MKRFKSLKLFSKKYIYISGLLLAGFIFRLILVNLGYHVDILSVSAWGEWIYKNGTKGFYYNSNWIYAWPTQLPIINLVSAFNYWLYIELLELFRYLSSYVVPHLAPGHMLWWFRFVIWFDTAKYPESPLTLGYLVTTKLTPIIADILIAAIIYLLALKRYLPKKALIWPALYLFSPFSFYISSLWGQVDQLSFLFLLLSIIAVFNKKIFIAILFFSLSIGIKPTTMVILPYFLFLLYKQKVKFLNLTISVALVLAFLVYTTLLFTDKSLVMFIYEDLIYKVIFKSEFRVSTNSFNFWHILIANKALNDATPFLLIPAKVWGYVSFILFNILAISLYRENKVDSIFKGVFIVGSASWLFMTNMLERYYFIGIVMLLILTIYQTKLIKYWLIASLLFWINLYYGWWFPEQFNYLRLLLISGDGMLTRLISLINVLIFIVCIRFLFKHKNLD